MKKYEEYINEIDRLFGENKAKDAEQLMLKVVDEARAEKTPMLELQMLNELIGYYRVTSERENLISVMNKSVEIADKLGLSESEEGKIPYATTMLNVANGYRSIGDLEHSMTYYKKVQEIYLEALEPDNMLISGLYNNMSLLFQEHGDYKHAMEKLLDALDIVIKNNADFEIAVTYANLANTAVLAAKSIKSKLQISQNEAGNDEGVEDTNEAFGIKASEHQNYLDKARAYALKSISCFDEMGFKDAHYCAALSALGMCNYYEEKYQEAYELFQKGMDIVEHTLGRNSQYLRLKENRDMCADKYMTGLKLSRLYYEEYGKPMLHEKFSDYVSKLTVGLVGEGSDCFGYDDISSRDHDWGPEFCIFVPDDLYDEIGEKLKEEYAALPTEYMGYKSHTTKQGDGRRGVLKNSAFYGRLLGASDYESIDWSTVKDYALAAAVNGEIFEVGQEATLDAQGSFSDIRAKLLKGYPENVLYLKLADDMARISQTGQYNYGRMLKRGDRFTADMMLVDCIRRIMILVHHMNNVYPPHDKWLSRSFDSLTSGTPINELVRKLHSSFKLDEEKAQDLVSKTMDKLSEIIVKELYARNIISDIETYLDYHTDELVRKASYSTLTDEELVDRIVRIEFEAFDKVKNEGGRAFCQNDWPTFYVMRKSQYLTWNRTMLLQYIYDFTRELEIGHNLITEKYGRMMESTAPEEYKELEKHFEKISDQKKAVIEQIVALQMDMLESFGTKYPKSAGNARSFHTYEDNIMNTSYETYLRGEISTYSDKMLQLYGAYVVGCARTGRNIAAEIIGNTAKLYGYDDMDAFEASIQE